MTCNKCIYGKRVEESACEEKFRCTIGFAVDESCIGTSDKEAINGKWVAPDFNPDNLGKPKRVWLTSEPRSNHIEIWQPERAKKLEAVKVEEPKKKERAKRIPTETIHKEVVQYITDNYRTMSYVKIGKHLNMTPDHVKYLVNKLGLKRSSRSLWTQEELLFLSKNYATMPTINLCKKIHKCSKTINYKAFKMGLTKVNNETI